MKIIQIGEEPEGLRSIITPRRIILRYALKAPNGLLVRKRDEAGQGGSVGFPLPVPAQADPASPASGVPCRQRGLDGKERQSNGLSLEMRRS